MRIDRPQRPAKASREANPPLAAARRHPGLRRQSVAATALSAMGRAVSRCACHRSPKRRGLSPETREAFTLIELLSVIAIIGILAAVVAPSLNNLRKGDATKAAAGQLQAAVARARQLAISQHTTVYMIFAPPGFWGNFPPYNNASAYAMLNPHQRAAATNVFDKQLVGYTYVTLRSIGDQPGRPVARYIDPWRTLPESTYIPEWKFLNTGPLRIVDPATEEFFDVYPFQRTLSVPFPLASVGTNRPSPPRFAVPFVGFDYLGRLIRPNGELLGRDEYIPLAHGSVRHPRNVQTRAPVQEIPSTIELPPGNSTNSYNLVRIDWLTGRPRIEARRMR